MSRAALVLALLLAGCAAPTGPGETDAPLALPPMAFYEREAQAGVGYHSYEELTGHIAALAAHPSGQARREVVGESREGRPIEALVLGRGEAKPVPLFDGGHHPNELEGVESVLFTAEFLLRNYATNATARAWVDTRETWFIPLVNPDGYVAQTRQNAGGVNLNRNYDIAWCHPAAFNSCAPEPFHSTLTDAGAPLPEYAGTGPFSEPESSAIRDLVLRLGARLTSYLTHHTDLHCLFPPWVAPDAGQPFPIPPEHAAVVSAAENWTIAHTEFGAGDAGWGTGSCVAYNHGGGSMDWVYATAQVPAFTMETGGTAAREGAGNFPFLGPVVSGGPVEPSGDLAYWMRATLPVELWFLANAERLQAWSTELLDPPLPEGVPPAP